MSSCPNRPLFFNLTLAFNIVDTWVYLHEWRYVVDLGLQTHFFRIIRSVTAVCFDMVISFLSYESITMRGFSRTITIRIRH